MSTAAVQERVQEVKTLSFVAAEAPAEISEPGLVDQNPFAMMAIFIAVSLSLAVAIVGSLAVWLYAIRDSGVMSIRI